MAVDDGQLADLIYEAAVVPELWPQVLESLARSAGSYWAVLLTRRADAWIGWRFSSSFEVEGDAYMRSDIPVRTGVTSRLFGMNRSGFVSDAEAFTEEEFRTDPYWAEWLTPLGFRHNAATAIQIPNGDTAVVQVTRRRDEPRHSAADLARLDGLRPHLARAGMLSARWKMERLRAAAEALALIGLPAAVLDADSRAVVVNALVEGSTDHVVWLPRNGLAFRDRAASALLRQAVRTAALRGESGCSLPVRSDQAVAPLVAHVIPLRGEGRDLFDGGYALLVLTQLGGLSPDTELIQGLFDLTAAEAKVAAGVARGWTIDSIAQEQQVGRETVRTQLRSVLLKTGTTRQAELAAKLGLVRMGPAPRT